MTPKQMLDRVRKSNPPSTRPNVGLIIIPNRMSQTDLAYSEESCALMAGICPKCSLQIDVVSVRQDGTVEFQCKSESPYHFFTRSESFLKID